MASTPERTPDERPGSRERAWGALGLLVVATWLAVALGRPEPTIGTTRRCDRVVMIDELVRCDEEIAATWSGERGSLQVPALRGGDALSSAGNVSALGRMPPEALVAFEQPVWINEASSAELETLPRVGPVLARRIVEARPFARPEDLLRVRGVGPATLAGWSSRLRM